MNKKGNQLISDITIAIMIFAVGMLFANFLPDIIDYSRSSNGMDCDNQNISDGAKVVCLGIDLINTYWIVIVISTAGGVILSRFVL